MAEFIEHKKPRVKPVSRDKSLMPLDYARCHHQRCCLRNQCLRYTSVPHVNDRQHWVLPQNLGLDCYMYDEDREFLSKFEKSNVGEAF